MSGGEHRAMAGDGRIRSVVSDDHDPLRGGGVELVEREPDLGGAGHAPGVAPARPLLSQRESEVLQLLADGHTTDGAAGVLFLSPATVRSYVENAIAKLEARNRVHAVAAALRLGLIR